MKIRGVRIQESYTGMCNQLIQLLHGIIVCVCDGVDIIIVDDFKTDLYSGELCPIEKILDMDAFCSYTYNNYGVLVVGKRELDMDVLQVIYGTMTRFQDITREFKKAFLGDGGHLCVPHDAPLNRLTGDPTPFKLKSVRITFQATINMRITKHYTEENRQINCHFKEFPYLQHRHWPENIPWMETLARNLSFHPFFYQQTIPTPIPNNIVHVVHVRLEYDAMKCWSKANKMEEAPFSNLLASKYICAITQHIKNGTILILSYNNDNQVVDFLKDTGRPYIFIEKDKNKGREWNAVQDMALSEKYGNGVFIGTFDIYRMQGSTYSYFLMKRCLFQKHILIDIERIHEEPLVVNDPWGRTHILRNSSVSLGRS